MDRPFPHQLPALPTGCFSLIELLVVIAILALLRNTNDSSC